MRDDQIQGDSNTHCEKMTYMWHFHVKVLEDVQHVHKKSELAIRHIKFCPLYIYICLTSSHRMDIHSFIIYECGLIRSQPDK